MVLTRPCLCMFVYVLIYRGHLALVAACRSVRPQVEAKQLVRANRTRWSSFYDCLVSIKRVERAIKAMLINDSLVKKKKDKVFKEKQLKKVRTYVDEEVG